MCKKRSRIREQELNEVLANEELDNEAKAVEIQKIVGNKFIPLKKYNDEKQKSSDAYTTLEAEYNTYKQSKMTDEEKRNEYVAKLENDNKTMKLDLNRKTAENIFVNAGLEEEEYSEILEDIVGEDKEKTVKLAKTICKAVSGQKEKTQKAIKEKIAGGTPKPEAGKGEPDIKDSKIKIQEELQNATKRGDYVKMAYYTRLLQEIK